MLTIWHFEYLQGTPSDQKPPPEYIVQNGHIYYQGPALGAGPGSRPPAPHPYPYSYSVDNPTRSRETESAYPVDGRPIAGSQTVVVKKESRAGPFAAGLAVGCCVAACCTVM
ncbi:hypothetical protein CLCR_05274 [Cladophialophora carrionii]|uniref:Uncharacterized protein n=1 Tax=Cladophialophora carrionii TaxID=86049 RepID=A0A1C1CKE7_9EURO|nr:hypothetical protein CLCR_05274 [Cladophialophora carrionii]